MSRTHSHRLSKIETPTITHRKSSHKTQMPSASERIVSANRKCYFPENIFLETLSHSGAGRHVVQHPPTSSPFSAFFLPLYTIIRCQTVMLPTGLFSTRPNVAKFESCGVGFQPSDCHCLCAFFSLGTVSNSCRRLFKIS